MEPISFAAAGVALLATPGPTNTLLATSGAAVGWRRSLPLLGAELCGYLLAITLLQAVAGQMIGALPSVELTLRVVVALYLVFLAFKLWRHGAAELGPIGPVTFSRVFVTTLLNPKGLIFAFTLLPQGLPPSALIPWLSGLALMILTMGVSWIAIGAWLRSRFEGVISARGGYRLSAVALVVLAGAVGAPAIA